MRVRRLSPFWMGLLLLVLFAAVMRLLSYNFSLPYVYHDDEPNMYQAGLEMRGQFDNPHNYDGYPPGYIIVEAAVQTLVDTLGIRVL
jgi:hypothetical protein